ncbi:hypothetical protein [Streptomyces sp. NPDC046261]|uniref:hypothetical protein n=1 Tax=Streptomyces sp. NPDC046261 TaxID=3157200 RepID=UPI0033D7D7E0
MPGEFEKHFSKALPAMLDALTDENRQWLESQPRKVQEEIAAQWGEAEDLAGRGVEAGVRTVSVGEAGLNDTEAGPIMASRNANLLVQERRGISGGP